MFYKTDSVGFHDVNSSGMPGVSFNLKNGNRFLLYVTDEDLRLYDQVERKQIWVKQDSLDRKVGYSYDSSDPDKLLYTGQASVNGAVYTNMPLPTWFSVYTMMVNGNEEFATQVAVTYIGAKLFVRGRNDGEWSDWVEKQLSLGQLSFSYSEYLDATLATVREYWIRGTWDRNGVCFQVNGRDSLAIYSVIDDKAEKLFELKA